MTGATRSIQRRSSPSSAGSRCIRRAKGSGRRSSGILTIEPGGSRSWPSRSKSRDEGRGQAGEDKPVFGSAGADDACSAVTVADSASCRDPPARRRSACGHRIAVRRWGHRRYRLCFCEGGGAGKQGAAGRGVGADVGAGLRRPGDGASGARCGGSAGTKKAPGVGVLRCAGELHGADECGPLRDGPRGGRNRERARAGRDGRGRRGQEGRGSSISAPTMFSMAPRRRHTPRRTRRVRSVTTAGRSWRASGQRSRRPHGTWRCASRGCSVRTSRALWTRSSSGRWRTTASKRLRTRRRA